MLIKFGAYYIIAVENMLPCVGSNVTLSHGLCEVVGRRKGHKLWDSWEKTVVYKSGVSYPQSQAIEVTVRLCRQK